MIARCFWLVLALALSAPVASQDAARRSRLADAFAAADAGRLDLAGTRAFAGDPLLHWLQASVLARDLRSADAAAVMGVLDQAGCATYSMESVEPQVEP